MRAALATRRVLVVLVAMAVWLARPDRAEALFMVWNEIERQVDWTVVSGGGRYGIAQEHLVKKWFLNEHDGREELSVGTAIHFGTGSVTVPCRLRVLIAVGVGTLVAAAASLMLPGLMRRWSTKQVVN